MIISINDFLFFRIEDEYVISIIVLYIVAHILGIPGLNFVQNAIIATSIFLITYIMNCYNLIGGGDVKLLIPLILLSGTSVSSLLVGIALGGFFVSLIFLVLHKSIVSLRQKIILSLMSYKKQNKSLFLNILLLSLSRINKRIVSPHSGDAMKQEIPYGIALACGGFYVIFEKCVG